MGYKMNSGRWADTELLTLHASGAETVSGTGPWVELGYRGNARLTLNVTAAPGGGGTLDVSVETTDDPANTGNIRKAVSPATSGQFAQATIVGAERKSFSGLDRFVRANWTIAVANPFTFDISGEAC